MGFGSRGRIITADGAGDLVEAAGAIERVILQMARVRQSLDAAGAPLAATYVEGACDAMSFALEALLRSLNSRDGGGAMVGVRRLRLQREGDGVYGNLAGPLSAAPPAAAGRSLGADLASDTKTVAALRGDDVAAALMSAALAHSDWFHLASNEVFGGDALAARAVVSTIVGRTSFPTFTRSQLDGLIHSGSADALEALGWHRMTGAPLPGA